tara:strand:+ start:1146 stop:1427 length:282 start_codon:yes stop_codon:yes gene_type:complete
MNIDLTITHQQGGMREFQRTGVYPNYLIFYSPTYKRTWKFKLKKESKEGELKIKGTVVYNYKFDESGCEIQEVKDGVPVSKWIDMNMIHALQD